MPNVYPLPPDTPVNNMGMAVPPSPGTAPLVGLPYTPNVDPGLVAFDLNNFLHTINWETFVIGVQYYLPPTGRLFISGNYSGGYSNNIASLFHPNAVTQPWVNSWTVFPTVAILRREPVLRRDAGDARGRVVPAGHAGTGG